MMYFKTLPDHRQPGFNEKLHFSRFGKSNMIFNATSNSAGCDKHVGCLSIKTVTEGEEWYGIGDRWVAVRPGHFLILNDRQEYSCRIEGGMVRTVSVFFEQRLASDMLRDVQESEQQLLDQPFESTGTLEFVQTLRNIDPTLHQYLTTLVHSLDHNGYEPDPVKEQMITLLDYMLREQQRDMSASKKVSAVKASTQKELYRRLCIARDMFQSHFKDPIELDSVSTTSCLSVPQLVRQFKCVFGVTPHRYLSSVRLQRASELLKTTKLSVNEIAWTCGFENVSAFCRAFKRKFGTSSLEARRASCIVRQM